MQKNQKKLQQVKIAALRMQEKETLRLQAEAEIRQQLIIENMKCWMEKVLPVWNMAKGSNLVKQLCFKGIPPNIRGRVWPLLIENDLQVIEINEFYNITVYSSFIL
jgi:hypothetical protein